MGDPFVITESKEKLLEHVGDFLSNDYGEEELKQKYKLGKNYVGWIIENKKKIKINYRLFDEKWTVFNNDLLWRWRFETMQHFLKGKNVGLVTCRQTRSSQKFFHSFITNKIIEACLISNRGNEINYLFPLYLYNDPIEIENGNGDTDIVKLPNLREEIVKQITKKLNLTFINEKENTKNTFAPIDILDYIYAILHSPTYRKKYQGFLKIDFPRVPYPREKKSFWHFVKLGGELRQVHLLENSILKHYITRYPKSGTNEVEKIIYTGGRVYINKRQYFANVPEIAWQFYIGGYQPAQKWLKDRKNKVLSTEDINHYQKIIVALVQTDKIMKKIDGVEM